MDIICTENITKKYINHTALDNVTLTIPQGCIYGLLGPNGAGKTTFLRIINRIIAPDTGTVYFMGQKFTSEHLLQIGYLPEERGLYKKMKVGEQALYLAQLKGLTKKDALKRLKFWFEKFEIQTWWDKKVEELSKGMQQKIQFVITILHNPQLLIFDEPFSGFDPINANMLKNEILQLKEKGATIIFSTHDMASVEELCDYISLINQSKQIINGKLSEVKNKYKSNIFDIEFSGPFNLMSATLTTNYEILKHDKFRDSQRLRLRLLSNITTNQLLSMLMQNGNIISFNEVIPSMNDIFIKAVEEYNKTVDIDNIAMN